MKYHIGNFKWKKYKRMITEYYISDGSGDIVAGDFTSYGGALAYIRSTLLRKK